MAAAAASPGDSRQQRAALDQCIAALLAQPEVTREPCLQLREKLASNVFNLVVAGQFKRGKTSLINALIGTDLLPVGVIPLTSIVTILSYGDKTDARVIFTNGDKQTITAAELEDYVTERGNPRNCRNVREVHVTHPSYWLRDGVRLIDTPGVGSVYSHNTEVAYRFIPNADALLFLLSVDQPVSQAEHDFLRDIRDYAARVFVVLNKADLVSEAELDESLRFCTRAISDALGENVRLFPVSARLALQGALDASDSAIKKSRLPLFIDALADFLHQEKGATLTASAAGQLSRIIAQARFNAALELKTLTTPLDELRRKLALFEDRKRGVLTARTDFDVLLGRDATRMLMQTVEDDLARFTAGLTSQLSAELEQCLWESHALPLADLREALEARATDAIRMAFDAWRATEDVKIAGAFRVQCTRHAARINDTVDALYRFASDLFAIRFDAVDTESLWQVESHFRYKFWSEPVSLQILASSFILALPRRIGARLVLKNAQRHAVQAMDAQSGRSRHDFSERLEKSAREFHAELMRRIDATIDGIEAAVRKGSDMAHSGEAQAHDRCDALVATLRQLDAIGAQAAGILRNAGHGTHAPQGKD